MLVIRPVTTSDLDDLYRLAHLAGTGLTTLPTDKHQLASNIETAVASFASSKVSASDYFLLVMEDTDQKKVVGTSGVYSRTGSRQAFYAYRLMSVTHYSHSLDTESRTGLLHLTNEYSDCSEVGTLFLDPACRGNGHWLSRARYFLMAQHRTRFASHVISELRGVLDDAGNSPVWDAIGQHFFHMSFDKADRLCGQSSNQFITELMPKYPIYTNLLPSVAREALGKPHKETRRAMELLLAEGFTYENLVDIFDGGPLVRCQVDQLKSIKGISEKTVEVNQVGLPKTGLLDVEDGALMLANTSLPSFRLVHQIAAVVDDKVIIDADVANALKVNSGDSVLVLDRPGLEGGYESRG